MYRYDGDAFRITAMQGIPPDYAAVFGTRRFGLAPERSLHA